jgi:glycosyltransferase involved in cell wall biosynthesis
MKKPKVTLLILSYKQENYIKETIESALAQTYSPLNILISDDCSPDSTSKIIQDLIAGYSGPHSIFFNENKVNLGLIEHINYVKNIIDSDFVIFSAGDDVSHPTRVEKLTKNWMCGDEKVGIVYSNINKINSDSAVIGNSCHHDYSKIKIDEFIKNPFALISSYAIDKFLWDTFPPLLSDLVNEDIIFPLRCLLSGYKISYIDEPLLQYRVGVGVSKWQFIQNSSRRDYIFAYESNVKLWNHIIYDINYFLKGNFNFFDANKKLTLAEQQAEFCNSNFIEACKVLLKMDICTISKAKFLLRVGFPKEHYLLKRFINK